MCQCGQPRRNTGRKPSRRARTRTRKPKYLSLRHQLTQQPSDHPQAMAEGSGAATASLASAAERSSDDGGGGGLQLDLFPLYPEHLDRPDPHVASLLEPEGGDRGGRGGPTLSDLLGSSVAGSETSSRDPAPSSPSMNNNNWEGEMARRALRGRERWEFCCSSSSTSSEQEEASSQKIKAGGMDLWRRVPHGLSLKLDYKEILTAWSDRGSLYIEGEPPQVVPEITNIAAGCNDNGTIATVFVDVGCTSVWSVPEASGGGGGGIEEEEKMQRSSGRKARVMRYKEKRRSRLFSKRIRYEVRKLNAEKRPRVKGRFVKKIDNM